MVFEYYTQMQFSKHYSLALRVSVISGSATPARARRMRRNPAKSASVGGGALAAALP